MIDQAKEKEPAKDYYAGYYWGNDPYESYDMPGRKSDGELKNVVKENIRKSNKVNSDGIEISVNNATVTLTGHVKTYQERRVLGQEVWRTPGVIKVLNDLQVTEPETAGPSK